MSGDYEQAKLRAWQSEGAYVTMRPLASSWEQRKLGELCTISKGHGYSKADIRDVGTPLILYGRLYTQYESRIENVDTFAVEQEGSLLSKGNEVIVPASGETAEDIAVASSVRRSGIIFGGDLNVVTPVSKLDPDYIALAITYSKAHDDLAKRAQGKSVVHVHGNDIAEVEIPYPSESEQKRISTVVLGLDSLITLHQRKYDKLCTVKKSMLDKMFPKPGETEPEMRFEGFTDPWEQRKLGELGFAQSGIGFPDAEQGGTEGTPFFKVSDMNTPGNEYELVASNNYVTAEQIACMGWHPIVQVPAIFFAKVGAAVMLNRKRLVNKPFLLDNNTMAFSMDSSLLNTQFGQSLFERLDLTSLIQVGALPSYSSSDIEGITVSLPSTMDEQRQIGQCLCRLNTLITLHQRKLELLGNIKKSLLDRMFV